MADFVQSDDLADDVPKSASLAQVTSPHAAYAPQSGQIFGVLSSMKETFETNLAKSQQEESTNQQSYEDLKAAKEEVIKASSEQADTKTGLRAEADEKHAQAKVDLKQTEETKAADTAYLASVKEHCANIDQEYEERVKTRQLEIGAVSKALAFLTSEESQDLISRTLGLTQQQPSFVQVTAASRAQVAQKLKAAAKLAHDPQLLSLAARA